MRKISFICFCLLTQISADAQIARWIIPPMYEKMALATEIDAIMTDSAGMRSVWTLEGKKLLTTPDQLFPFKEGFALAVKRGSAEITTVFAENGNSFGIDGFNTAHGYPYFSNGQLLVQKDGNYKYIDSNGKISETEYTEAFPYFNGYSACKTYKNMEKKKDPINLLRDVEGKYCSFSFSGKSFDAEDVQFVSSVNDKNIAIVVINDKVYFFDGRDRGLIPVINHPNNPSVNLKEQAKISSDISQSIWQNPDSTYYLQAKCGKKDIVTIVFDPMKRPISISIANNESYYKQNSVEQKTWDTELRTTKNDRGLNGLHWNNIGEMLPPQFEDVITCFDNKAIVKEDGRVGLLEIFKDESFKLKMNKDDDIGFAHKTFETKIRADFPTFLPADKVSLEIDPQSGCEIDKTSKEGKDTESANFVEYKCSLKIPDNLPDKLTDISYPVTVQYDGLTSSELQIKVKAWHYKYFVVDIDESQTTIEDGTVSFVFNINSQQIANDGIFLRTVDITADSLDFELDKQSEFRYKCKVLSLREGINNIDVKITEQGCPPASFPFEVEYHKPVAKTKTAPAVEEKVTIKKKKMPKAQKTPKPKDNEVDIWAPM